jgi:hypothetical protein
MLAVNKTLSLNSILVVYNTEPLFLSCLHFVSLPAYFSSPLGTLPACLLLISSRHMVQMQEKHDASELDRALRSKDQNYDYT